MKKNNKLPWCSKHGATSYKCRNCLKAMKEYEKYEKDKCKQCGRFMPILYIECCIFGMCSNKKCSNYGQWPKEFENTRKYIEESAKRGSFCYSVTPIN